MANRILVVDDDQVTLTLVTIVLQKEGFQVFPFDTPKGALSRVDEIKPELVIVDVTMPEMDGYELTRRLRRNPHTAHVPIMILTSHDTVQDKIKGFEAGAEEYITKPFEPAELLVRARNLLRRIPSPQPEAQKIKGKGIAVFSLRGGAGTSTIAANLAVALSQLWGRATGLIDLVFTSGQSALMLNLPLRKTWADLAHIQTAEIDFDLINQVLLPSPSGAFVLAAPNRPEQGELLDAPKVAHVLALLKEQYQYLVLDLPHDFQGATLAGLDNAEQILLILSPDLASVHAAACALDVFDALKYSRESVKLVVNCVFERNGLARKEIQDALQHPVDSVIPFAPGIFVAAINTGVPPVFGTPTSAMGALFEDFAYQLSRPEHQHPAPARPTAAWQRVNTRAQQRQAKRV